MKTKIFLDSGDPLETKKAIKLLGFLDGQTTNPTLVSKNPAIEKKLKTGKRFKKEEVYSFYKKIAKDISKQIPKGSVSIEIYVDNKTKAEEIVRNAKVFDKWIPNAYIKIPITKEGLRAASQLVEIGININMTLCFSQKQAAAVYLATKGAKKGQVFISPFIGRLDDIEKNGIDLIANILKMYKKGDGHVKVVAASIRNLSHLTQCINLSCDIVTVPFKVLNEWKSQKLALETSKRNLFKKIPFQSFLLKENWKNLSLKDKLTDKGIKKFCEDWNSILK